MLQKCYGIETKLYICFMKLEKELIRVWKKRFKGLPVEKVANSIGIPRQTLNRALKGNCSFDTMNKINLWLIHKEDFKLKTTTKLLS